MFSEPWSVVSGTASVDTRFDGGIGWRMCLLHTAELVAAEDDGSDGGAKGGEEGIKGSGGVGGVGRLLSVVEAEFSITSSIIDE